MIRIVVERHKKRVLLLLTVRVWMNLVNPMWLRGDRAKEANVKNYGEGLTPLDNEMKMLCFDRRIIIDESGGELTGIKVKANREPQIN